MSTYRRLPGVVTASVGDELVLLNPQTEVFFALNDTGQRIWDLLEDTPDVDGLVSSLCAEYDVTPQHCREAVVTFLDQATEHGVVLTS